jgi:hypothetical protein
VSRLDEIKAREQAAFGGPWEALDADENGMHAVAVDGTVLVEVGDFCDAEFIAHARDDIPHLLALVESLTADRDALAAQVARVEEVLDHWRTVDEGNAAYAERIGERSRFADGLASRADMLRAALAGPEADTSDTQPTDQEDQS